MYIKFVPQKCGTFMFVPHVPQMWYKCGTKSSTLNLIKNGWITADKYNSQQFRCHTPNTVVVFSNEKPDIKEAVKDRWRILQIKDDDLIDISKQDQVVNSSGFNRADFHIKERVCTKKLGR